MPYKSLGINLLNQKGINFADGTSPTDAVTKQQLDNAVNGLAWKQPVRAASTANGTLATAFVTGQTLDGVTLATGDRILLKDQTTASENGIRVVATSGAPARAGDADTAAEVNAATVYVTQGTVNADKSFTQTADAVTLDTTGLVFAQVGGGTSYTFAGGLQNVSGTVSVKNGAGILADATSTRIDPTYTGLAKRYSQDLPATGAGTALQVSHNLGTLDVVWQIRLVSDGTLVDFPDTARDANSVTVTPPAAITAAQYRITVLA